MSSSSPSPPPSSWSLSSDRLDDLRVKRRRGDQGQDWIGDSDREAWWSYRTGLGEVPARTTLDPGTGGGALGVTNLSSGFIVLKSRVRIEFMDALLLRRHCSRGTDSVFTFWPGRKGQAVVDGREGS